MSGPEEPYPGATPLATAAWRGQVAKVKKLLKEGADVNKRGDSTDKGASPEAPLLLAINKGHREVVNVLLNNGADANIRASNNSTPLINASRLNQPDIMKLLLAKGAVLKGTVTGTGETALHAAVQADAKRALNVLLDHGADINILSADGYAPLHEAAASASWTKLLVDSGADPKLENPNNGCQPLHLAARLGKADVCNLLISAGADINAASKDGLTPLHEAAQHAQAEIIELLVAAGAACMAEDKQHKTPLSAALTTPYGPAAQPASFADDKLVATVSALLSHGAGTRGKKQAWPELVEAASAGHAAVVQLLINKGAPASSEALAEAARAGRLEVVELLLKRGAKAQPVSSEQPPPPGALHMAARFGHAQVVHLLIKHGASTTATCDHVWAREAGQVTTPLQIALEHGHAKAAEVIIQGAAKAGADISGSAEHAVDMLHKAANTGDTSMVTLLLDVVKVGPNAQHGREQHAPLHVAAKAGYLGGIIILLQAGASINLQNKRGHTPLFVAVTGGHFFCVQHLIKAGADPNIAATDTRTALFAAAANAIPSSLSIVDCLLDTANSQQEVKDMVSVRTKDDRSVLHSACASSNVDVVRRLLKAGADVNVQSKDGATPIARAAACGNMVVIKLLQQAGGRVNVRNTTGMTPLAYAASRGQAQLVSTLISMGCPVDTPNRDGTTPLHQAATAGNQEVVVTLLGRGANPKAQDKGGFMPHHDAASKGQLNTLRVLLQDKRTPINEGVHDGLTALHMAASEDKEEVIKLLIGFGADVEKRSYVDGRTALHYAARWASQNATSALLAASASFTTVDNSGKTPLHLAVAAPIQEVDELMKQALIRQGQPAAKFVYANNVVSVVRELLSLDHTSATVPNDDGHTPLMIAADRACESPSEITELVLHMLERAGSTGTSSGVISPPRGCFGAATWAVAGGRPTFRRPKPAQTAWGKPAASAPRQQGQQQQQQQQQKAQAVHGNGFTNQGWSDDEDPELHPDGEHGAQKEADEGYTEQAQPVEDEEEVDKETLQARTDAAAADAAADAAAQALLREEAAEKEAAAERAARAAVKRAKKKKRQKAAKKTGPQPLDDDDDFLDKVLDPASHLHPPADPPQLGVGQFAAGVPFSGQGSLSANHIAAFQAGVQQRTQDVRSSQGQPAAVQAQRGKAAPLQAAAQEVTQPAVAADTDTKQGKKRGSKKQAQKAVEPVSQGSIDPHNLTPTYPHQASWDPASSQLHHTEGPPMQVPLRKSQYDYQPERYEQPHEHNSNFKQFHVHSDAHQHSRSGRQQQIADYFHGPQDHAQPDSHKHQSQAESQYPLHFQYPRSSEVSTQSPSQQPSQPTRGARQPPGFPAQPQEVFTKPTPQDLHFPPLHQAVAGSNRKQSHDRTDARPTQHQSQQQPPQQHGDAPGGNQTYSFADLQRANQELQQLQQQQPMTGDNSRQMAQMMQMQMQMQQMMMSMMAQQQQGGNPSPAPAQPAMTPTWNQPAFPLNQALPSSFLTITPNPAYRSNQYGSSGMQTQDEPRRPETRPPRRLIKGLTENELRNFTCPITHDIMWEPVVASDGHTYEKDAIEQWLAASPDGQALSPMTQVPMGRTVFPNKIIADLIRDKQVKA